MKIALSGSTGLVGSELKLFLEKQDHQVFPLVRQQSNMSSNGIYWNPQKSEIEKPKLEALDAVIHLAGESVATGRWTPEKKSRILDSRVKGTRLLASTLSQLQTPPEVLISASAVGYYGDQGQEELNEDSQCGADFLARVCQEWEQETVIAKDSGIRVVTLRIGIVLSPAGGALKEMLLPFSLGLGGPLGMGEQFMSWIDLDDLIQVINHCLHHESLVGPVNGVAPYPVSNLEFTRTLGRVLKRPTFFMAPQFALKLALGGEKATQMLLNSTRAVPEKLLNSGFQFSYPTLEKSLRHLI